ncbi:MAG: TIGR03960 family B12-binding radical SAM protein [Actinomycetota bacterium]|nr:TIGR03960 family B12-binding radical SAM protein [Actinomycetota bacterium]
MTAKIDDFLSRELPGVTRPGRYLGIEVNARRKPLESGRVNCCLIYPDVYEIGMSNLGLSILYEVINDRTDSMADRAYLPWVDMQERMREKGIPLFGLESRQPLGAFDLVGITLQHELTYANVVRILKLAQLPLMSREREGGHPLVVGGGPGAFNPEPLAELFDFLVLGEGEEVIGEIIEDLKQWKYMEHEDREGFLEGCASIPGVYVPSMYEVAYRDDGSLDSIRPRAGAPYPVRKRVVADLNEVYGPRVPLVPLVESVHDRCSVEIFRGCTRGCRFCQAGMIYRPVRERGENILRDWAWEMVGATGCDELSLTSLNSSDYSRITPLCDRLSRELAESHVAISLPSLRTDTFSVQLASRLRRVKRTGLTFAPETGSARLRATINKGVSEEDLLRTISAAYQEGWRRVKLYFMVGLPGESEEDVEKICVVVHRILREGDEGRPAKGLRLMVSVSTFVPKPHTPFQWVKQMSMPEIARRHFILKQGLRTRRVTTRWHTREMSYLEGVLSRGDRRLLPVIIAAASEGCLDNWNEMFSWERWRGAMEGSCLDPAWYVERERYRQEVLPWDHLHSGVEKDFLWEEYMKAGRGEATPDCRWDTCTSCGACSSDMVEISLAKEE